MAMASFRMPYRHALGGRVPQPQALRDKGFRARVAGGGGGSCETLERPAQRHSTISQSVTFLHVLQGTDVVRKSWADKWGVAGPSAAPLLPGGARGLASCPDPSPCGPLWHHAPQAKAEPSQGDISEWLVSNIVVWTLQLKGKPPRGRKRRASWHLMSTNCVLVPSPLSSSPSFKCPPSSAWGHLPWGCPSQVGFPPQRKHYQRQGHGLRGPPWVSAPHLVFR